MEENSNNMETVENLLISKMSLQLKQVRENYNLLLKEWMKFQNIMKTEDKISNNFIMVNKSQLSQLVTETSQLKLNLSEVLNNNYVAAITQLSEKEEEVKALKERNKQLEVENEMLKSQFDVSVTDCQREKKENLQLRCDIQEISAELTQQCEFCSSLGSAVCTLLWRVSRCEDSIETMLAGSKVDEFLGIVSSTLQSYISAYKDDWPQQESEELNFILALSGVITNVAASAYGRDFLVRRENGHHIIDTFVSFLADAPLRKSARLKNLLLMTLYNLSINQKGQKYICSKQGIMGLLSWHLQEETDEENQLNTLRVLQSLVSDDHNLSVLLQLNEVLPVSVLQTLTTHRNKEIQDLSIELVLDLNSVRNEQ